MQKVDTLTATGRGASTLSDYNENLLGEFDKARGLGRGGEYLQKNAAEFIDGDVARPGAYRKIKDLFDAFRKSIRKDYPQLAEKLEKIEEIAKTFQEIRELSVRAFGKLDTPLIIENQIMKGVDYIHQQAEALKISFKPLDAELDRIRRPYSKRAIARYLQHFTEIAETVFSERIAPAVLLNQLVVYGRAASDCERRAGEADKGVIFKALNEASGKLARRACPYFIKDLEEVATASFDLVNSPKSLREEQKVLVASIDKFSALLSVDERVSVQKQKNDLVRRFEDRLAA